MRLRVFIILSIICFSSVAQSSFRRSNIDFIAVETGLIVDTYNSLGARLFFEYQKQLKPEWLYGISYEHSRFYDYAYRDRDYQLQTNLTSLSFNFYRRINLTKQLIFWTLGAGAGLTHVNWRDNDKIGLSVNASLTLNIQLTKRVYIITSPLLILLPTNRIRVSTISVTNFNRFYAYTAFPVGIKIKL